MIVYGAADNSGNQTKLNVSPRYPTIRIQIFIVHALTRVDLLVGGDTISINNGLESTSELIDLVVGWRLLTGLHAIQDGRNGRTTMLLHMQDEF